MDMSTLSLMRLSVMMAYEAVMQDHLHFDVRTLEHVVDFFRLDLI